MADLVLRQIDGRESRRERVEPRVIVTGDDPDVLRAADLVLPQRLHEADHHQVIGHEHRVRLPPEQGDAARRIPIPHGNRS
jgi:hypothetical protein